jgi:hypothetical protein
MWRYDSGQKGALAPFQQLGCKDMNSLGDCHP